MEDQATSTAVTCVREQHSAAVDVLLREPSHRLRGPRAQADEAAAAAAATAAVPVVGQQEGDVRGSRVRVDGRCKSSSKFIIWPLNAPLKAPGGPRRHNTRTGVSIPGWVGRQLDGMQG